MSVLTLLLSVSLFQAISCAPMLFLPNNVTIPENAPRSTLVAKITATAAQFDSIVGAPFIVNSNPVIHPFTIIPKAANYWELITTNTPKLDFEAVPLYTLQILVEDSKGTTATQSIVIEISKVNKPPVFIGTLAEKDVEIYIPENTPVSTVIYKVAAKDPDKDVLQYSVTISPGNSGFKIDNTGTIITTEMFDYESNTKSYTLTVDITDGSLAKSAKIIVHITNVNDNDPTLTCVFYNITTAGITTQTKSSGNTVTIELNEELPAGRTVNTCTGSDADQMNDLSFFLDPGNPYFSISKETGTVVIISRMDSEAAGFVSVQSYTVKVCDRDQKCASILATANILPINDNPPFCDSYMYRFVEPEPILKDTIVATLNCHDPDVPPKPLEYKPHTGPIGADKLFQQTATNSPIIQVNNNLVYDIDPVTTYEMMLSVSDSPDTSHTVTTTIIVSVTPVNNYDPQFDSTSYNFTVRETSEGRTIVGQVSATDRDLPSCIKYKIRQGNTDIVSRFWINPTSGILELVTQLDFEFKEFYTLGIEATDCDTVNPRTALATVTVNIIEENDEAPVCRPSRYTAVIYDNITTGININNFRLNCKDRDSENTDMRFEIASGNINNHFAFNPTHGSHNPKLIVKTTFDFENGADRQQRYNLVVHIIDDNVKDGRVQQPRTGTTMIMINVVRTNTPAPPTTDFYKRKGLTIVYKDVNTYDPSAWYVPFLFTLMALFLSVLLAWVCHLIWKYGKVKALCQKARNKVSKKRVKTYKAGTQKEKVEVITETTTFETVFDGEAVDPVTGNTYEYNSKSGARRWKFIQANEENIKLTDISTVSETLAPNPPLAPAIKNA
ncbi:cadherin-related family member 3-like [Hyla sarda]|uniref:cadherin-related family member 3-like n=1 Tax=Hyla sarda TaxID=327740 RepID=UPI0024C29A80|nr:cadherin-related family member 3-like [Hyla sarda]